MQYTTQKHLFRSSPPLTHPLAHPIADTRDSSQIAPLSGDAPSVNRLTPPPTEFHSGRLTQYARCIEVTPSRPKRYQGRFNGGERAACSAFTSKARQRMMFVMNRIQGEHFQASVFTTLTYHNDWEGRDPRKDIDVFLKRQRRRHPALAYIWRLEPQKRLAPHFHFILFFPDGVTEKELDQMKMDWHEIVAPDSPYHALYGARVEKVLSGMDGITAYLAKYASKIQEEEGSALPDWHRGRYWAASRNLPIGEVETIELRDDDELHVVNEAIARCMSRMAENERSNAIVNTSLTEKERDDKLAAAGRTLRYANVVRSEGIRSFIIWRENQAWIPDLVRKILADYRHKKNPYPTTPYLLVVPRRLTMPDKTKQERVSRYSQGRYRASTQTAFFKATMDKPRFASKILQTA